MKEYRCAKCVRLMFKASGEGEVEIKCPKCGYINKIELVDKLSATSA